jgi:UDP-N-acetylglucosamine 2-epimerase
MLDQVLDLFGIQPDYDLNSMRPGQSLTALTTTILDGVANVYTEFAPWAITTLTRDPVGHQRGTPRTAETSSIPWMVSESGILISS